jgi:diacylglycerol kinase family enzyme
MRAFAAVMKPRRVAVILNGARDRGAAVALRPVLEQPGVTISITCSLAEARHALYQSVSDDVDVVLFGGGDGTLSMGMSILAEACRDRRHPAIGVLRLGTGNAFAHARNIAAGVDGIRQQLTRARDPATSFTTFRPLETLGVRAPFCGFGIDAQLIGDHAKLRASLRRLPDRALGLLGQRAGGAARYALSIATLSLPHFIFAPRPRVAITNLGAPAQAIDRHGRASAVEVPAGAVLWQGACTMAAAATISTFGFGLRMFPYANRRSDRFQLRASDAGVIEIARNTRAAFAGTYSSEHVHDFLVTRVAISMSAPSPFEVGGEAMADLSDVEIALGPELLVL